MSGVAWKAHLLPIRVLNAKGSGSVSTVLKGEEYAAAAGAKVVNMSLGGAAPSQAEYDALRTASSTLFVVAAGNDSANVDTSDSYPCAYDLPNVVCVAATGGNDQLADFSNYGAKTVDIAAPGVDILSTWPTSMRTSTNERPGYDWLSGTSMATPEVAGAAALVLSHDLTLTPWQVRAKLMAGADRVDGLKGKVTSGGRLDVYGAMSVTPPPADGAPAAASARPEPAHRRDDADDPDAGDTGRPDDGSEHAHADDGGPDHGGAEADAGDDRRPPRAERHPGARRPRRARSSSSPSRLKASVTTSERATVRFELRLDGPAPRSASISRSARPPPCGSPPARATLTTAGTKAGQPAPHERREARARPRAAASRSRCAPRRPTRRATPARAAPRSR